MRPARLRTTVLALSALLVTSACAARFARPTAAELQQQQQTDQGGQPVIGPSGSPAPGTAIGTTGGQIPTGTTGVAPAGTAGGTTGGTTGVGGTTGGSTSGGVGGGPPANPGSTTGISGSNITIGLFVPKTGAAPVPATVDAQAQNYFNYVKTKGGIWGRNVTIKIYDTGSTEDGARSAVQQAVSDGIFAAVSLDRLTVEAALTAALHNAHIPHLVAQLPPSTTIPDDAFYIGMNQLHHGPQIADYMVHTLHKTKLASIIETDPGLNAARDAFVRRAKSEGASVYATTIDPSQNDFTAQVNALCASKAETTWLYMAPTPAINIAVEYKNLCPTQHMTWVGNSISWGFNLVLTPAAGALDGAKVFSPWGGLNDPRYATFNQVDNQATGDRDKDIGLAAWGFGQIVAAALKAAGPHLGRNTFLYAMQNLRIGSTDVVTGAPMCWSPLDFTGGKRYGSGDKTIVMTVQGSGSTAVWATESDYRSAF